jgi:hypothetical protein
MLFYTLWFDDGDDSDSWLPCIDKGRLQQAGGDIWAYSRCEFCRDAITVPCGVEYHGLPEFDCNLDPLTSVPIVSNRLARLFTEICPNIIQLVPAQIDAPGSWWIVNVLPLVDAIDYAKSVISFHKMDHPRHPGKPAGIVRLMVKNDIPLPHIFRVKDFTVSMVVSEVIRERCQEERITNMKFIPATIEEWFAYWNDTNSERWCYRPPRPKKPPKRDVKP